MSAIHADRKYHINQRTLLPVVVLSCTFIVSCSGNSPIVRPLNADQIWCQSGNIQLGFPERVELRLGTIEEPEVNIDELQVGPRNWIFGATEENGYMFILDPNTRRTMVWNAGRQEPVTDRPFEGDITDFTVWEEDGNLIVLASHAHPAEIYRYEVPIPDVGLPTVTSEHGKVVFSHPRWIRVGSVTRGLSQDDDYILLAGSITRGGLVRSDDGGHTWHSVDYVGNSEELSYFAESRVFPNKYSSLHSIFFTQGRWFIFTRGFAPLASEVGQRTRKHFINGILYSKDGANTWNLSSVEKNSFLPSELTESIAYDIKTERLPDKLYGLVGEAIGGLEESPSALFVVSEMNTISEEPFGGRILRSDDKGESWKEVHHFREFRDIELLLLRDEVMIVGSVTKTKELPLKNGLATGEMFISTDNGATFHRCPILVASEYPSKHRPGPYWVAGVHSMILSEQTLVVGTVNEGEAAELFLLDIHFKK